LKKLYQFKKLNRPLPDDMAGLLSMIQGAGGLPKNVSDILKKKQASGNH